MNSPPEQARVVQVDKMPDGLLVFLSDKTFFSVPNAQLLSLDIPRSQITESGDGEAIHLVKRPKAWHASKRDWWASEKE